MLVLGVLLVLCAGGGTAAYALVVHLEGRGTRTPVGAVDGFLRAVFVQRDEAAARRYLCAEADPSSVRTKIDQIRQDESRYGPITYTWTSKEKSKHTTKVVFAVDLTEQGGRSQTQHMEVTTVASGGWRVCGVRRVG